MTMLASIAPGLESDPVILVSSVEAMVGPVEALMLYGSHARGNAGPHSDIDVLVIVREGPRGIEHGPLTVTAYVSEHLRMLAERGSLFVLHLRHDGRILHDPCGVLATTLAAYRPPVDPRRLQSELTVAAAGLLAATDEERANNGAAMRALGYYLIRTAVYDACARTGHPQFDLPQALDRLHMPHLAPLLAERRLPFEEERLDRVLAAVAAVLPGAEELGPRGLAARAVTAAETWPLASDLLAGVLAGDAVSYTTLTLPPT